MGGMRALWGKAPAQARACTHACRCCCRHGRVALVAHSAGGWLARILLGDERYQGEEGQLTAEPAGRLL